MDYAKIKKSGILLVLLTIFSLPFELSYAGITVQQAKEFTVINVDLDIDSDNDSTIEEQDDPIEMNEPGKLIYLNQDDDNKNDTEDKQENTAEVTDENDLQPIKLSCKPANPGAGQLILDAPTGKTCIQVWTTAKKGPAANKVNLPKTWNLNSDTVPGTLYVEGISTGAVVLKLSYKNGTVDVSDEVKAAVIGIDFVTRADTSYGYDDGTVDDNPIPTSADNPPQKYDWASLDKDNKTTDVDAVITPVGYAQYVHFVSSDTGKATEAPGNATASPQKVTITGKAVGKPNILCRLGTTQGAPAAQLNLGVYTLKKIEANFYKVKATGLDPDATTCAQFETGANAFLKLGVSELDLTDQGLRTIEYDVNGTGNSRLDIDTTLGNGGPEWATLTTALAAPAGQKVLHLKNSLRVKIGANWFDATGLNWGEWIIITDASLSKVRTLAHEALHNLSLADTGPPGDNTNNIMYYSSSATKYFVGYFKVESVQTGSGNSNAPQTYEQQWDKITR